MTRQGSYEAVRWSAVRSRLSVVILCLLITVSGISGCSVAKTAYNQFDWLMTYYLAKHFDLDKEQKSELRVMVDRNLDWHRETQLPLYSEYLYGLEASLDEPVTEEQLRASYGQVLDFWDSAMLHIVPDAQAFLSNLNDEQVEQMVVRMEENNQEMYEKYSGVTPEERQASRDKNTIKGVERVIGKLNKEQKLYISDSLSEMEDATEDWVDNRRRWQRAFVELVQERPTEDEYRERLTDLYVYPRRYDEPEFQEVVDRNLDKSLELMTGVLNSLTPKQRKKAQKRFRGFAEDFDALAAQTKPN
jgi:hypothetical protein